MSNDPDQQQAPDVSDNLVWYVAYGSNLYAARLSYYLSGGRPQGAARTYPGARNPRPPRAALPAVLPGSIYFAGRSTVWGGGMAFYDPSATGTALARAYLVTAGQFCDIAAQEMRREPGQDLDLSEVLRSGRSVLGSGRYETLVLAGYRSGHPMLTFTAPNTLNEVAHRAPTAAYLRMLGKGLLEAHGMTLAEVGEYLADLPGASGAWTPGQVVDVLTDSPTTDTGNSARGCAAASAGS